MRQLPCGPIARGIPPLTWRPRMQKYLTGFREFLLKQNAFALAIGVIIGAAVSKVVTGLVEDILMPLIGLVLPGAEWRSAQIALSGGNALKYGDLLGRIVDFVIIAAVVYALTKLFIGAALAPATKS